MLADIRGRLPRGGDRVYRVGGDDEDGFQRRSTSFVIEIKVSFSLLQSMHKQVSSKGGMNLVAYKACKAGRSTSLQ